MEHTTALEQIASADAVFSQFPPPYADRFLDLMSRRDLPDRIPVQEVARYFERTWTELRPVLMGNPRVVAGLAALGWAYRGGSGCRAHSYFERTVMKKAAMRQQSLRPFAAICI
jgi:hypothetical protein